MNEEIWKPIKDYEGHYEISNQMNVKSLKRGKEKLLKLAKSGNGYFIVDLYKKGYKNKICLVHRLIAEAFIPNPENKPTVNHINGDKADNRIENLEWATDSEQQLHAI